MKKIVALLMALCMVFALCACGQSAAPAATEAPAADAAATEAPAADATAASDLKVGFIFLHDENSTYDLNFMNGAKEACANLGLTMTRSSSAPTFPKARSATTQPRAC